MSNSNSLKTKKVCDCSFTVVVNHTLILLNGNYPKAYGVNNISVGKSLPDDCRPAEDFKYWEYPILSSGPYDGLGPGTDCVLIAEKNGACMYCLMMTHKGATDNRFVPCVEYTA